MEQEIGSGWADNVHPDDVERCLNTYVTSFDARQPFSMEYRLRRHDGRYRWVLDRGIPLYGSKGEFTGYIGSCIDITDRKASEEELKRANEDLNQFAFAASHDLQEPLRMITSYAQLLLKSYRGQLEGDAAVCAALQENVALAEPDELRKAETSLNREQQQRPISSAQPGRLIRHG